MINVVVAKKRIINISTNATAGIINTNVPAAVDVQSRILNVFLVSVILDPRPTICMNVVIDFVALNKITHSIGL